MKQWAVACFGLLCCLAVAWANSGTGASVHITEAQLAPGAVEIWQAHASTTVPLGHEWRKTQPQRSGIWTYRLALPAPQRSPQATDSGSAAKDWVLYIPRAGNRLRFVLDGVELASFGDLAHGEEDYSPYPLLIKAPQTVLPTLYASNAQPASVHELLVQVAGDSRRYTGLSTVWWGPADELTPRYKWRHIFTENFFYIVLVLDCLFAVGALASGFALRQKPLVWFGVTSALAAVHYFFWRQTEPSLPFGAWLFAQDLSLAWNLLGMQLLCFHIMGMQVPRLSWVLKLLLLVYYPIASLLAVTGVASAPKFWATNFLNIGLAWGSVLVLIYAWRHRNYVTVPLATFSTLTIPAVLWTQWNAWVSTAPWAYEQLYLTPYVRLLYMVAMALCLGVFMLRTIHAQGRSAETLQQTVAQQRAELTLFYEAQQRELQRRAQSEERQRIMHDMHDGLGAKLLQLESISLKEPVPQHLLRREVRNTLDEFRMSIDAMEPYDGDLLCLLGQLRMRMQDQLADAGVQIIWQVGDVPENVQIDTMALAHVQRMVAEALTNVLKHAHAKHVTVGTHYMAESHCCSIQIEDDGIGFMPADSSSGQGLSSMRRRAQLMGGSVTIAQGLTHGCCVRVVVPCI